MRFSAFLTTVALALTANAAHAVKLAPDLAGLAGLPQITLPVATVQKGLQTAERRKDLPLQFAVGVAMPLGLADGAWDEANASTARWRLKLHSPGAYSLHAHLSRFRVPAGAELWFYDAQGQLIQGPFTQADENADGKLATALVLGDTAALELRVPKAARSQVELAVSEVFHGYTDIRKAGGPQAKAGACERDVVCPEGNAWSNEIRSVARLQIGQFLCSGQLVNNTRQDETPFLITANHCGVDTTTASNMVAYFNFQRSSCGSGNGSLEQFVSGASFRRSNAGSDYALVVLNSRPSPAFNVYYSGWNSSGDAVTSGSGIHHPQGDEKSISLFSSPAQKIENACSAQDEGGNCVLIVDSWEVGWSSGVTEQGSSGSGLWNQNRQLVGVLSGGSSDCNGAEGNGQTDFYGRLDAAWNEGGLKAELDAGNSGATELEGKCAGGTPGCMGAPQIVIATPAAPAGRFGGGSFGWVLSAIGLLALAARRR